MAVGDPIDTSTLGVHQFTVTGTDVAGNETTVTITYSVEFLFCLLYDPGNEQPTGGAVPIKLSLCDSNGETISKPQRTLTAVVVVEFPDVGDPIEFTPSPNDTGGANVGFEFRVQGGGKSYIYNLNPDELFDSDGNLVALDAGHFALGFVIDAELKIDPDSEAPVPVHEDEIIYFAEFRLKD